MLITASLVLVRYFFTKVNRHASNTMQSEGTTQEKMIAKTMKRQLEWHFTKHQGKRIVIVPSPSEHIFKYIIIYAVNYLRQLCFDECTVEMFCFVLFAVLGLGLEAVLDKEEDALFRASPALKGDTLHQNPLTSGLCCNYKRVILTFKDN